jgi:hypothetical protein
VLALNDLIEKAVMKGIWPIVQTEWRFGDLHSPVGLAELACLPRLVACTFLTKIAAFITHILSRSQQTFDRGSKHEKK